MTKVITRINNLTELAIISTQIPYRISLTLSRKNVKKFSLTRSKYHPTGTQHLCRNGAIRNAPPGPAKLPCCPGNAKITQKRAEVRRKIEGFITSARNPLAVSTLQTAQRFTPRPNSMISRRFAA